MGAGWIGFGQTSIGQGNDYMKKIIKSRKIGNLQVEGSQVGNSRVYRKNKKGIFY